MSIGKDCYICMPGIKIHISLDQRLPHESHGNHSEALSLTILNFYSQVNQGQVIAKSDGRDFLKLSKLFPPEHILS